jgi:low affinity Fe/Cu permease
MMKKSNPVFDKMAKMDYVGEYSCATYKGIGIKVLLYVFITLIGAGLGIFLLYNNPNALVGVLSISGILTLICVFVNVCKTGIIIFKSCIELQKKLMYNILTTK